VQPRALAFAVETSDAGVAVDVWDAAGDKTFRIEAKAAVLATPIALNVLI